MHNFFLSQCSFDWFLTPWFCLADHFAPRCTRAQAARGVKLLEQAKGGWQQRSEAELRQQRYEIASRWLGSRVHALYAPLPNDIFPARPPMRVRAPPV